MTEPQQDPTRGDRPSLADVAAESPGESVRHEREAVGDDPDAAGVVPTDDAQ